MICYLQGDPGHRIQCHHAIPVRWYARKTPAHRRFLHPKQQPHAEPTTCGKHLRRNQSRDPPVRHRDRQPAEEGTTIRGTSVRYHRQRRSPGRPCARRERHCSLGIKAPHVRQPVRRQCPCLSSRALEQPQTAGPCCSLRELPAPPRILRFPAHARGVPALPPRLDKGTGGRAAGHKEALS